VGTHEAEDLWDTYLRPIDLLIHDIPLERYNHCGPVAWTMWEKGSGYAPREATLDPHPTHYLNTCLEGQ